MFYSSDFYFDKKHCSMFNLQLVSESSDILNEHGMSYAKDNEGEITLSFTYAKDNEALPWNMNVLESALGMFICDEYKEFISMDNEDICFLLKGKSYVKRFNHHMKGIIDITFDIYGNCAYKKYVKKIKNKVNKFMIYNYSNINMCYKPVIELTNILSTEVSICNTTSQRTPLTLNHISSNKIEIDNMLGTIIDDTGQNLLLNSNRKWIELGKGNNVFNIVGDCTLLFKAYYPIRV